MLDDAQEAVNLTRGRVRGDLDVNRLLELSLVRLMEITGEAANRVSPDFQSRYPHVPWPQIVSLGHRLIHGYEQERGMLPNTVSSRLRHLYSFLRYLVDREVAHPDLLKRKRRVKVPWRCPGPWTQRMSRNSWQAQNV